MATKDITVSINRINSLAHTMESMAGIGNKTDFAMMAIKAMQIAMKSETRSDRQTLEYIAHIAQNMSEGIYKVTLELPEDEHYIL